VSSVDSPFRSLPPGGQANLQCVTDTVCYGTASSGDLYRTDDGGQTWQKTAAVPLNVQFNQLIFSCSGPATCAVVGGPANAGEGTELAYTSDGGSHWRTSAVPLPASVPDAHVVTMSCADGPHCVLSVSGNAPGGRGSGATPAARVGTFLATADGGRTWSQATSDPAIAAGSIWTMTCSVDGSCLAVAALGENPQAWVVALRSHDWGATWVAGPPAVYNDAAILYASCGDATHCMLVPLAGPSGAPYEIATTSDAGMTWQVTGPPVGWTNMPTAVSCATGQDCWVAMSEYDSNSPAGAYSQPSIQVTHDGGQTWSDLRVPAAKPPISDVLTLSCPSADGCMGIGNLEDHFVPTPLGGGGRPHPLSGPLVISDLPAAQG
jgi:photosystem II stability/assembly factor-like uncharacterized protein